MDLIARTATRPAAGETVLGTAFVTGPGGKGSNQAIAAARAGADVSFLGAVGDDGFAEVLRRALHDAGVDTTLLRTAAGPSGVAVIVVDDTGENSIVVVPGANATVEALTAAELDRIAGADTVLCQLELPIATVAACAVHARGSGTTVFLNPSPAQSLPDDLVAAVDVLLVNETEARQLGAATLDRVPHVVTTLGGRGARWRGPNGAEVHASAPRVDVVDTTGAGDAFAGTLAASWHLGPEVALRRAVAAGALATTRAGAAASCPTAGEVDDLLARHSGPKTHP
ncbi:ribokinase [Rhodococcus sp. NPDC003318]|uniref:ribokinase n=1 Tax=Rhodococcus sp. NPDC003318 TaxID=3364503 RepID=UPI0036817938